MRRSLHLAATLLLGQASLFIGTAGLSAVLAPMLLNSCQNVQPEGAPDGVASEQTATDGLGATPGSNASVDGSGQQPTTAKEDLVSVQTAVSADSSRTTDVPTRISPTRISATTRRTARGLPSEVGGYPSWNVLEDPEGLLVPRGTEDECRAYIDLPPEIEATVGDPLELPFKPRTLIVIESKRAGDDFIRSIDTLRRGDLDWELRCFVRAARAESFQEEAEDRHPDDAACRTLLESIAKGKASLVLGE